MEDSELRLVGYILIEYAEIPDYLELGRPEGLVLAPTECICKFHPPNHAISWIGGTASDAYIDSFNLELSDALDFRAHLDSLFDSDFWGRDGVFISVDSALQFKNRYLSTREDVVLVGLAVDVKYLPDFVKQSRPPESTGPTIGTHLIGTHLCASLGLSVPAHRSVLGYETISINAFGGMHTSMCYGVRPGFVKDLGAGFNKHGFITTLEMAQKGAEANNHDEVADSAWYAVEVFIPYASLDQLQETSLEEAYKAHALEWAKDPEAEFWDTAAVDDGLNEL